MPREMPQDHEEILEISTGVIEEACEAPKLEVP